MSPRFSRIFFCPFAAKSLTVSRKTELPSPSVMRPVKSTMVTSCTCRVLAFMLTGSLLAQVIVLGRLINLVSAPELSLLERTSYFRPTSRIRHQPAIQAVGRINRGFQIISSRVAVAAESSPCARHLRRLSQGDYHSRSCNTNPPDDNSLIGSNGSHYEFFRRKSARGERVVCEAQIQGDHSSVFTPSGG